MARESVESIKLTNNDVKLQRSGFTQNLFIRTGLLSNTIRHTVYDYCSMQVQANSFPFNRSILVNKTPITEKKLSYIRCIRNCH